MKKLGCIAVGWTSIAFVFLGCAHEQERPVEVPEGPPRTLELLSESEPQHNQAFPPVARPIRRGPCGIPLAVAPEGLIEPGGIRLIQAQLVKRGLLDRDAYKRGDLDARTLAAILELQQEKDLPTVGVPTYATVRELGLDPNAIFLSGDPTCKGRGS